MDQPSNKRKGRASDSGKQGDRSPSDDVRQHRNRIISSLTSQRRQHDTAEEEEEREQAARFEREEQQFAIIVDARIKELARKRQSLNDAMGATNLQRHATQLAALAVEFVDYKDNRNSSLYTLVHRNPQRRQDVERVIKSATKAAKLFEQYAQKKKAYSRAEVQVALSTVLSALGSLK